MAKKRGIEGPYQDSIQFISKTGRRGTARIVGGPSPFYNPLQALAEGLQLTIDQSLKSGPVMQVENKFPKDYANLPKNEVRRQILFKKLKRYAHLGGSFREIYLQMKLRRIPDFLVEDFLERIRKYEFKARSSSAV